MLKTNANECIAKAVLGAVSHPRIDLKNPYIVDPGGSASVLPGTGGITYNFAVGDPAIIETADHLEPCVSITLEGKEAEAGALGALNILSCIGNEARVVSGEAAGSIGTVTGKHGGVEHVMVDFPPYVLEKLAIGDRIQIRSIGQGLKFKDHAETAIMNLDPRLLGIMGIEERQGVLVVPVTHVIPVAMMGSGIGSRHSFSGDFDIQVSDRRSLQRHHLMDLRIGDVIAIRDVDCRYGRAVRSDAVSIGIVVHSSCLVGGHGPGVTVVMSSGNESIVPKIDSGANIGHYLGIGRYRRRNSAVWKRKRG